MCCIPAYPTFSGGNLVFAAVVWKTKIPRTLHLNNSFNFQIFMGGRFALASSTAQTHRRAPRVVSLPGADPEIESREGELDDESRSVPSRPVPSHAVPCLHGER